MTDANGFETFPSLAHQIHDQTVTNIDPSLLANENNSKKWVRWNMPTNKLHSHTQYIFQALLPDFLNW